MERAPRIIGAAPPVRGGTVGGLQKGSGMRLQTSEHWGDETAAPIGWTEYSVSLGHSPLGHQFAVVRRRTARSTRVLRHSRSTMGAWNVSEFEDIMGTLESNIREHLIVTSGLQLTLPFVE